MDGAWVALCKTWCMVVISALFRRALGFGAVVIKYNTRVYLAYQYHWGRGLTDEVGAG